MKSIIWKKNRGLKVPSKSEKYIETTHRPDHRLEFNFPSYTIPETMFELEFESVVGMNH